jgi:hypothetical protein
MKTRKYILISTGLACVALINLANAQIYIDFGSSAGDATGNYNLISGDGVTGNSSISSVEGTYNLIDFETGEDVASVEVSSNATSGWGDSASAANWTGDKPSELSGIEAAATDDGLYLNNSVTPNPVVSLVFSGLEVSQEYLVLFYSARGNNGTVPTNIDVSVGTGSGATISSSFQNSTEVGSFVATTTADGFLTLDYTVTGSGTNAGALNFMSLTTIPEPSAYALLSGLLGLGCVMVRRCM